MILQQTPLELNLISNCLSEKQSACFFKAGMQRLLAH